MRISSRLSTRWLAGCVLALPAALGGPSSAMAAHEPPTFQDSAIVTGSTATFTSIDFVRISGPSGEDPTGHAAVEAFGFRFTAGAPDCLAINGNMATAAGPLDPNPFGVTHAKTTVVDNGPAGTGLDTYVSIASTSPFDCSSPVLGGENLITGDAVVIDSPPPPTSSDQCKLGGYEAFGFANQGQCVAYVKRGPET
jgi:hypothetical protein